MIVDNFRANIEIQLAAKGWSRSEFARRLGKSPAYVTQVLNKRHDPGLRVVEEWSDALHVKPWDMLRKPRKLVKSA